MENNQYENIPPMLPSNDCCGGELPRIQDLKELDITNKNCIMIKKQDLNQSIKSQPLQSWLINKDLIIQDLKDVIVDLNKRINTFDKSENEYNALLHESNEKIHKVTNDLNICQSANKRQSEIIKELQLENSEVNKLLSTYKFSFYLIASIVTVVSIVGSIITLIK